MPGASSVANGGGGTKRRISEPVASRGGGYLERSSSGYNSSSSSLTSGTGISGNGSSLGNSGGVQNGSAGPTGGGSGGGNQLSTAAVMKMKAEVFEKDRDNFLMSFEKPTQIYRFLRARMIESPIFLQRNLSYMKARMSRSHKSRIGFKVDELLAKREKEDKRKQLTFSPRRGLGTVHSKDPFNFYNIIVMGITDGQIWHPDTRARVDICIAKVCPKKRKDGPGPITKISEKFVDLKVYSPSTPKPSNEISIAYPKECPVISIPASDCSVGTNGHTVRSYKLVIRVTIPQAYLQQNKSEGQSNNNHLNSRNNNNNGDNLEEPKAKRRRSAPTTKDRENFIYDDTAKGSGGGGAGMTGDISEDLLIYTGNISLYENEPLPGDRIREADFDVQLKKVTRGSGSGNRHNLSFQRIRREITFESFDKQNKVLEQTKPAGKYAKICIAVRGSHSQPKPFVEAPLPLLGATAKKDGALKDSGSLVQQEMRKSVRVIYHFMHGNNSQQQTESRDDMRCPWCSLNCMLLYALMKHLKLCHPRYQFSYSPIPNGAKIDVSINDSYDGSYSGSAIDLVSQPPGEAFARNGPTKRTEVFSILVCRPKPSKHSLQEFFECDEKDVDQRRTYITGHNRLYHHTSTCLPIHPREIDVDSEGEPDPEWLRVKTTMMIDEFTDVNEGEKELMKLWNLHVMKYNYVGDCQIPLSCKRFVELHGREIIQKNLYRNFCLHLTNLFDFGLLTPQRVHSTIHMLHSQMRETNSSGSHQSWKSSQGNNNAKNGNGINGIEIKFPPNPLKSFNFSGANATSSTPHIKTGSAGLGTNTATSTQIGSGTTSTANSSTVNNNSSSSSSAPTTLVNSNKKLELKLMKVSTPPASSVGTRNNSSNNCANR